MPNFAVIIAAAGQSRRFGSSDEKKTIISLQGKPVWLHSAEKFAARPDVRQTIVVVSPEDEAEFWQTNEQLINKLGATVVAGGAERMDSVSNGLDAVNNDIDFVAIHDGARPCVSIELIESLFDAAKSCECVIPAIPVSSTVKRSTDGGKTVAQTVDRSQLYLAQTPQVFSRVSLVDVFEKYYQMESNLTTTDEAQLAEHFGVDVRLMAGCKMNIKLTTRSDLQVAETFLQNNPSVRFDAPIDPSSRIV
jgi:2-C-methyl-D-erythritol 4-phosphate cytidylyltransferase